MSNLLLVSTLQSKLDEGRCPVPPADSCPEGPEVQLEAVQRALQQLESEARVGAGGGWRGQDVQVMREVGLRLLCTFVIIRC